MNNKKGFTLIELLVTVAIIVILSGVIISGLTTARAKARDGERIQELQQLSMALEFYYDRVGRYPIGGWYADCHYSGNWIPDGGFTWSDPYMNTQPHDPINYCTWPWQYDGPAATYAYWSDNGQRYALVARLEHENPYNIRNAGTKWVDGNLLFSHHGWNPNSFAIIKR